MKKTIFLAVFALATLSATAQKNTYTEDWVSLSRHNQAPDWFADAKFGIYFHWGVYSVPAYYSEWYPYFMYRKGTDVMEHHKKTWGDPSEFNYPDFVPMFKGGKFEADEWAQLFQDAGARFAGPCAQHHDGFALWDSEVNPWNAADRGPHKDITGLMEKAIKKRDMRFITTFHHARNLQRHGGNPSNWETYESHFAYDPACATSSTDPDTAKLYGNIPADEFHEYWFAQLKEVIDQYSPDIMWFDVWLKLIPSEYRKKFAAYYLNEAAKKDQEVIIAYKQADMPSSVGVLDIEQGGKKDLSESVWLTDVTLSNKSWSYIEGQTYKTPEMVVRNMIDVWSKNGVVLLNVSPHASGVINREQQDILAEIGVWMKKHGEAVYGTRPFETIGFGHAKAADGDHGGHSAKVKYTAHDGRFLRSKDGKYLYLFMLGKPEAGSEIQIKALAQRNFYPEEGIKKITVMGSGAEAKWYFGDRNFVLQVPDTDMDEIATVFKMELN